MLVDQNVWRLKKNATVKKAVLRFLDFKAAFLFKLIFL